MVFAEVGNLIRRENKNSHCAGDTGEGWENSAGVGLQAGWRPCRGGQGEGLWSMRVPRFWRGKGRPARGNRKEGAWSTTQSGPADLPQG